MHRVFTAEQASLSDQFEKMVGEGQGYEEVAGFFKNTYNIEITSSYFYSVKRRLKKGGAVIPGAKGKRKYTRKSKDLNPQEENILKELVTMLGQIHGGYNKMFKFLRGELMRYMDQQYICVSWFILNFSLLNYARVNYKRPLHRFDSLHAFCKR